MAAPPLPLEAAQDVLRTNPIAPNSACLACPLEGRQVIVRDEKRNTRTSDVLRTCAHHHMGHTKNVISHPHNHVMWHSELCSKRGIPQSTGDVSDAWLLWRSGKL